MGKGVSCLVSSSRSIPFDRDWEGNRGNLGRDAIGVQIPAFAKITFAVIIRSSFSEGLRKVSYLPFVKGESTATSNDRDSRFSTDQVRPNPAATSKSKDEIQALVADWKPGVSTRMWVSDAQKERADSFPKGPFSSRS